MRGWFSRCLAVVVGVGVGLAAQTVVAADVPTKTIVVYGASGNIGSKIVREALDRGHTVIGVSRTPAAATGAERFSSVAGDVTDLNSVLKTIAGRDVVIVSVGGNGPSNRPEDSVSNRAALNLIQASRQLGPDAPRIIQVGGATTLQPSKEAMLANLPFPAPEGSPIYAMLFGHWEALQNYRAAPDVKWTVATPALSIAAGERTGKFRIDTETVVRDAAGNSAISQEDFALAILNEIESPQFVGQRFTVGY